MVDAGLLLESGGIVIGASQRIRVDFALELKTGVEMSLDAASTSACATKTPGGADQNKAGIITPEYP
jgi:hypothetical protein